MDGMTVSRKRIFNNNFVHKFWLYLLIFQYFHRFKTKFLSAELVIQLLNFFTDKNASSSFKLPIKNFIKN